ncbi:extracellular matrix protein 2 [Myripristis murdjan]|uniref:extracellular matrix protein 2 n=1 Tax=Myripristis murdjan TaxID=586833 RepID=UPI001176057B|nr:extracellular matrix protein 2-like [Myripristis murdjan]
MARLGILCLCISAVAWLGDGKASRRGGKPAGSKPQLTAGVSEQSDSLQSGQCQVNGIALFDGAMWSPQPCSACQCNKGNVKCQPIPCTGRTQAPHNQPSTAPKRNRLVDKDSKDGISEGKNIFQGRGGGRGVQELKKKKEEKILVKTVTPAMTVKPESTKNKKQEVLVKIPTRGTKMHVPIAPARPPMPAVKSTKDRFHSSDEDDFDDDPDSDDDDDIVGPPRMEAIALPAPRTMLRPVVARRLVPAPTSPGRPVVTFPQKPNFMESLPAGCLLSESLIACGSTGMTHMPIITDPGVKTLYLADNKISKIPVRALAGLPNLEWLDLSKNKLDDSSLSPLLFQNLTKLRRLILDGNNLTKVPAFLPPSLEELKINDNKLSGLTPSSFKGLSKLLTLELEDNYFHDGNVSPLTFRPLRKLIYLRLEDNKFRAIPSGLPASLQELHLSDNKIEEVHAGILNKTVNLRLLDLSHNRIREDRIAPRAWIHLSNLESLDLSHNKLVHVPSFLPVGLRQLTLHHNQIERIPGYVFGHMRPGLDSLQLSHNRLRDDGIDGVSFLGLSTSLSELLLDHNLLQSIPQGLLQLKNLQLLRLNHNLISYVPMNALCDTQAREDSPLISVHLQYNLIERRLIPPTAFSCIRNYHSILLRPQRHENDE